MTARSGVDFSLALAVLVAGMVVLVAAAACAPRPTLAADERQRALESFDYVWTTIRDRHFDPDLGGIDWPAVRDELRPRIEQARRRSEVDAVMRQLLSRLGQSHTAFIPAAAYEMIEGPSGPIPQDGTTGLDARVIDGRALVTAVAADSPAAAAGARPGWEILRIAGAELAPVLARLEREFAASPRRQAVLAGTVLGRLSGKVGQAVDVTFRDGGGATVKLELELAEPRGRAVTLGNLPPVRTWVDVQRLDGEVGYVAFNQFFDPLLVMQAFNEAMASFRDARGLVIDLRGNGGGRGDMAMGMIGWLVAEKTRAG